LGVGRERAESAGWADFDRTAGVGAGVVFLGAGVLLDAVLVGVGVFVGRGVFRGVGLCVLVAVRVED
jgi:hypothetical protein